MKGGYCFEIAVRMGNLRGLDWREIQNKSPSCSKYALEIKFFFSVVFMCLISPTQKFKLEKSTLNTKE